MKFRPSYSMRMQLLAVFALLSTMWLPDVRAAEFTVPYDDGEVRRINAADIVTADGVHVPLAEVVRALGGSWKAEGTQVQISLFGATALLAADSRRVFLEDKQYDLSNALKIQDNQFLIHVDDVAPFFLRCFRIPLDRVEAQAQAPLDSERPDLEEPVESLLERVEQPPASERRGGTLRVESLILDAGHGGSDSGILVPGGAPEKDIALAVTQAVARLLKEQTGLSVHVTRDGDATITEQDRSLSCREHQGDLFVSIHCASSDAPKHHGINVYYATAAPERNGVRGPIFSRNLRTQGEIVRESASVAQSVGQALSTSTGAPLQGVHELPLKVLNAISTPGLLVELGYLSNSAEAAQLNSADYQQLLAQGIVAGILEATRESGGRR